MNKKVFSLLLILTFILLVVTLSFAQPGHGRPPGKPPPPPNPQAPLDGGLGYLLAAGLMYGVHIYNKRRKR